MERSFILRFIRLVTRFTRKISRFVKVSALHRLNLTELFDQILPSYLARHDYRILWDIEVLNLPDSTENRTLKFENPYLNRKLNSANLRASYPNPFNADIAIVIQGPIVIDNQTTLRIVNFYQEKYPDAMVVISTWATTPPEHLQPFLQLSNQENIKIILNKDPDNPGIFNVNRQIVSTLHGLKAVVGKTYAIKTRTDQVLTEPRLLCNLELLHESYSKSTKKDRKIIVSSLNTFAFRLYGASDMFQFGLTRDLINFWEQPLDQRPTDSLSEISENLHLEAMKRVAEVYLNTNYFKFLYGKDPVYTFEESLNFITKRFVVADAESLGQRWLKNTNLVDRWREPKFPNKFYELSHLDWHSVNNRIEEWFKYESSIYSREFYND